jgi:hypothetical protein
VLNGRQNDLYSADGFTNYMDQNNDNDWPVTRCNSISSNQNGIRIDIEDDCTKL